MRRNDLESGGFRICPAVLVLLVGLLAWTGCGGGTDVVYTAEKELYEARKLRDGLSTQWIVSETEFLERTLLAYRTLLDRYQPQMKQSREMETIVVSARMDLAEIHFQAGMLPEARREFETAFEIADNVPEARIAALYSAAHLSEELEEPEYAIILLERMNKLFLGPDQVIQTAEMDKQYLITPLKLAELYQLTGEEESEKNWLRTAESFYRDLIAKLEDPEILKTVRYNLLATVLQDRQWKTGLNLLEEYLTLFADDSDRGGLLFLQAKIHQDGLQDPKRAFELFTQLYTDRPDLPQAPSALLSAAALAKQLGRVDEADALYKKVIEDYPDAHSVVAEAQWQLAKIDEEKGNWIEASARYQLLSLEYPTTIQGLEAPLMIAYKFKRDNEPEATYAAFDRALKQYEKLLSYQFTAPVKILAEEYYIRTLIEMERWQEAVDRLLALPKTYPGYRKFQHSYLTAAAILSTELNSPEAAKTALTKCIQLFPKSKAARIAEEERSKLP